MKQFLDAHELEAMAVPSVTLRHHQTALRHVLVSRAVNQTDSKRLTSPLQGVLSFMKKPTMLVTAGITALSLAAFTFSAVSMPHSVSAQQLAENSSKALAHLNPQDADYKKFYPYFLDWMQQAQKAKDLRVLTYEELLKQYPEAGQKTPHAGEPLRVIDNPSDNQKPDVTKLKYLAFSSVDGGNTSTIIVGINDDNIPEAALTHFDQAGKKQQANN